MQKKGATRGVSRAKALALQQRRSEVAARYLTGQTLAEIARHYGVVESTISRDLKHIRKEWQKERLDDFQEKVDQQLAAYRHLLREQWEAYQVSKTEQTTTTKTVKADGGVEEKVRIETRIPSAQLLGEIRQTLEAMARVTGVNAPIKGEVKVYDFSNLTDSELDALLLEEADGIIREAESVTRGAAAAGAGQS